MHGWGSGPRGEVWCVKCHSSSTGSTGARESLGHCVGGEGEGLGLVSMLIVQSIPYDSLEHCSSGLAWHGPKPALSC